MFTNGGMVVLKLKLAWWLYSITTNNNIAATIIYNTIDCHLDRVDRVGLDYYVHQ